MKRPALGSNAPAPLDPVAVAAAEVALLAEWLTAELTLDTTLPTREVDAGFCVGRLEMLGEVVLLNAVIEPVTPLVSKVRDVGALEVSVVSLPELEPDEIVAVIVTRFGIVDTTVVVSCASTTGSITAKTVEKRMFAIDEKRMFAIDEARMKIFLTARKRA